MTDTNPDPALSGESWAAFCDSLKAAGDKVIERSTDELDRLEGFRYLSRLARGGLQAFLENGDPPFADILPIALVNTEHIWPSRGRFPRLPWRGRPHIEVHTGTIVEVAGRDDDDIIAETRQLIAGYLAAAEK